MNSLDLSILDLRDRYGVLEAYRDNRAYRDLKSVLTGVALPADFDRIRALENPALQSVDFHVAHVFPGALSEGLPLKSGVPDGLTEAWSRIASWGNVAALKDALVEDCATHGDEFLKAVAKEDGTQVYPEARHPAEVYEFREDNRRTMRYVRLDVELEEEGPNGEKWWTEVWDKDGKHGTPNLYLAFYHESGYGAKLDVLGEPFEKKRITDFGHDFVPFVRVPFRAGARRNVRSTGVFEPHIETIDGLLRFATNLDNFFGENAEGVWVALRNQIGEDPIDFKGEEGQKTTEEVHYGRRVVSMPSMSRLEDMVPNIPYQDGLSIEEARRKGLERSLQELRYSRGRDGGDPAAAAIRQDQAPALRRAEAMRGNGEEGLLAITKMCLTMGAKRGLFPNVGTFEAGDFDALQFEPRAISPESPAEKYGSQEIRARVWREHVDMGTLAFYLENEEGFDPDVAERVAGLASAPRSSPGIGEILGGGLG